MRRSSFWPLLYTIYAFYYCQVILCGFSALVGRRAVCSEVYRALHELIHSYVSSGDYVFLENGFGLDAIKAVLQNAGINVSEIVVKECVDSLVKEGRAVKWISGGNARVLPLEAYQVRSILALLPYVDAKLLVEKRFSLRRIDGFVELSKVVSPLCSSSASSKRTCEEIVVEVFQELVAAAPYLKQPYEYQARSWKAIAEELVGGRNPVVISASTGEGKTEAFLMAILMYLVVARLAGRRPRVAILYPRKALAADQLTRFIHYLRVVNRALSKKGLEHIKLAIIDGDTRTFWSLPSESLTSESLEVPSVIHRSISCSRDESKLLIDVAELSRLACRDLYLVKNLLMERSIELKSYAMRKADEILIGAMNAFCRSYRESSSLWAKMKCIDKGDTEEIHWLGLTKSDLLFEAPDILVTNFETISLRMLDPTFREFLENLEVIVVDEAHEIKSVRGVHEALTLRRLVALAKVLSGKEPLVVVSSATLPDPSELARALVPRDVTPRVVDAGRYRDLSKPHEYVYHLAIIPSVSPETATTHISILLSLSSRNHKVLVFTNRRRDAERIAKDVNDRIPELARQQFSRLGIAIARPEDGSCRPGYSVRIDEKVEVLALCDENSMGMKSKINEISAHFHHAGLKKEDREKREREFKSGELKILAATSTLELGIDIGDVDAVVLHGTPPTEDSYRQRIGRGGTRGRESVGSYVAVTVIDSLSPKDVYFFAHFEDLAMGGELAKLVVKPERNAKAMAQHLTLLALSIAAQRCGIHLAPTATSMLLLDPRRALEVVSKISKDDLEKLLESIASRAEDVLKKRAVEMATNTLRVVVTWLEAMKRADESGSKPMSVATKLAALATIAIALPLRKKRELLDFALDELKNVASRAIELVASYGTELIDKELGERLKPLETEGLSLATIKKFEQVVNSIEFAEKISNSKFAEDVTSLAKGFSEKLGLILPKLLAIDAVISELRKIEKEAKQSIESSQALSLEVPGLLTMFSVTLSAYNASHSIFLSLPSESLCSELSICKDYCLKVVEVARNAVRKAELAPLQTVWGAKSFRTVKIVYEGPDRAYIIEEPLLEALVRYPPLSHSIADHRVYEAQYRRHDLDNVGVIHHSALGKLKLMVPKRISMTPVRAISTEIKRNRRPTRPVLAFAWVDPSKGWEYIEDPILLSKDYRKSLSSLSIAFMCPLCLCKRAESFFTIENHPYYYPLLRKPSAIVLKAIRSSDKWYVMSVSGPSVYWYPRIEENPPEDEMVICRPPHKKRSKRRSCELVCKSGSHWSRLKASTPLKTYPQFINIVLEKQRLANSVVGCVSVSHYYARVVRILHSIHFSVGNSFHRVVLEERSGSEIGVIGAHFPTAYLSLSLAGCRKQLDDKLSKFASAAFWWLVYSEVLRILEEGRSELTNLKNHEFKYLDVQSLALRVTKVLQFVDLLRKLFPEKPPDEAKEAIRSYMDYIFNARSGYTSYDQMIASIIAKDLALRILRIDIGSNKVKRFYKYYIEGGSEERILGRLADRLHRILAGYYNVPLELLRYIAIHSLSHALIRRVVEEASLDAFDVVADCGSPTGLSVGMYELFEGGVGVLRSFFERLSRDPTKVLAEIGEALVRCPRNELRQTMDVLLHPKNLAALWRAASNGVNQLAKFVERTRGVKPSAGLLTKLSRITQSTELLIGAATISLLVRSLEDLMQCDFDPTLPGIVLKHRELFKAVTKAVLRDEWLKLVAIARDLGLELSKPEDLAEYAKKLISRRSLELREASLDDIPIHKIVIAIEEIAPIHVDGCWMCLNVPSCSHSAVRSYTLQPYLSARLAKVLLEPPS